MNLFLFKKFIYYFKCKREIQSKFICYVRCIDFVLWGAPLKVDNKLRNKIMGCNMKTRRQYTRDFKIAVVRDIETGKSLAQVSRENGIYPSLIAKWKKEYFENPENAFSGNGRDYKEQARMAELERLIGQLYAENEFLKKALKTLESRIQEERKRAVQV